MSTDFKKNPDPKRQLQLIRQGASTTPSAPEPYVGPVRLVLPIPPAEVWPNARPNRYAKAKATKMQKVDTVLACIAKRVPRAKLQSAVAQPVFYFRTNRGRDKDNAAAALKASFDGLAKYGLLANDKGLTPLPPILLVDPDNPRLEIEIRKI